MNKLNDPSKMGKGKGAYAPRGRFSHLNQSGAVKLGGLFHKVKRSKRRGTKK